jgi:caa(3)-type oxidase subunit IV
MSEQRHVTTRRYFWTYFWLILLATLSFVISILPIRTGIAVALVIAFVKAFLVLGWFMHLVEESAGFKLVMFVSTLLVVTLIALTALDPLTRAPYPPAPADNSQYRAARTPPGP